MFCCPAMQHFRREFITDKLCRALPANITEYWRINHGLYCIPPGLAADQPADVLQYVSPQRRQGSPQQPVSSPSARRRSGPPSTALPALATALEHFRESVEAAVRSDMEAQRAACTALAEELQKMKRARQDRSRLRAARHELKSLKSSLRHDWRSWGRLCGAVLAPQPA